MTALPSPPQTPTPPCTTSSTPASSCFGYYFPDNHPSTFVSVLGAGGQGTALLVQSIIDGKLYVRKRKRPADPLWCPTLNKNETENALDHPNIPKLISQTTFFQLPRGGSPSSEPVEWPTAELWSYANGRDLEQLVNTFEKLKKPIPPVLIWHLMKDLLETVIFIHSHDIAHGDLVPSNIFIDWPASTNDDPNVPPKFLVGDFGRSFALPPSEEACKTAQVRDTRQAVYRDLELVAECVAYVMNGEDEDSDEPAEGLKRYASFAPALGRAFVHLADLPRRLQQFGVARQSDGDMFERVLMALQREIETGIESLGCYKADLDQDHLLSSPFQPPGPWHVAEFDVDTGALKAIDSSKKHYFHEAMITCMGIEIGHEELMDSGLPVG